MKHPLFHKLKIPAFGDRGGSTVSLNYTDGFSVPSFSEVRLLGESCANPNRALAEGKACKQVKHVCGGFLIINKAHHIAG